GRPPGRRMEEAEQEPDRRALAGAVRAEEAEDLARLDVDRQPLEGRDRAPVALAQAVRRDDAHGTRLHAGGWLCSAYASRGGSHAEDGPRTPGNRTECISVQQGRRGNRSRLRGRPGGRRTRPESLGSR